MRSNKIIQVCAISIAITTLSAGCNKKEQANTETAKNNEIINIDMGAEVATLDPQLVEDLQATRVANDLFEGLVTLNQSNDPIPGLARSWDISKDGKTYMFHLRDNLKFSDGTPITAQDFVNSWQRLVNPKTGSPYTYIAASVVNADAISNGKLAVTTLGIKAMDNKTIVVNLDYPDHDFLAKCTLPALSVTPSKTIAKYGQQWISPENIVTSGAYKLKDHVINGHLTEIKNPYYYDADNVKIPIVKFYPLVDANTSIDKFKSGGLEMTWTIPVDQFKTVSQTYKDEVVVVPLEGMVYYNFNMLRPEFKDIRIRKALSLAVNRVSLTQDVLGTGVVPLYSPVTPTVEAGKYASVAYSWMNDPRSKQIEMAKELYKAAGYGPGHELNITITYFTDDEQKKVALAIGSMWSSVLGVKVNIQNQDWKTFLQTRHKGDYQVSFGRWYADYNGLSTYTHLYLCNAPENDEKYCNPEYDKYINIAKNTANATKQQELNTKALNSALNDYETIPLYQLVVKRMINPTVRGYTPLTNHLDVVQSKWMHY